MQCEPECQIKIIDPYVPSCFLICHISAGCLCSRFIWGTQENWELTNKLVRKRSYCYSDANKLKMLFFPCPQEAQIPHFLE